MSSQPPLLSSTGFSLFTGKMPLLAEPDTRLSFAAIKMPSQPTLAEADTGLLSPAGTMSPASSRSGNGEDSVVDTVESLGIGKGTSTDNKHTVPQNQDVQEQQHQQAHKLTEARPQNREPKQRPLPLLSRPTPSLTTTLYTTTLTIFGVMLSPTLSIFIHLLSMLSIRSLTQEIRQLEQGNREKDEVIRELEQRIVVLEERETGLWRGDRGGV